MRVADRQLATVAQLCISGAQKLASAGIDTPIADAQLILAHVLGCSRLEIIAHSQWEVSQWQQQLFEELLARRVAREPLAYILGVKEFYGLKIIVPRGVFIPRPETELLVDECVSRLSDCECVIADIGTGTGAIAIALALALPKATVYAVDVCSEALKTAEGNVRMYNLHDRVHIVEADLLEPFCCGMLDAVVSNPPYVPAGEIPYLAPEISLYEPRRALDGGIDGLQVYKALVPAALKALKQGGFLAVEVGYGQSEQVIRIFESSGYANFEKREDLSGVERIVVGTKC